jgi:hypothetical protein
MTADVWVALVIAVFGAAVVFYYGWDTRHVYPPMKYLLYTLIGTMAVLFILCAGIVLYV